MGIIPISYDVPMTRWPWMNWVLMAFIVFAFGYQYVNPEFADRFIMGIEEWQPFIDEHPLSWLGHMFLHDGFFHLGGNLVFMWVFGNAVAARVGNLLYLPLWIGFGVITAIIEPYGLGASGAIYGLIGFCLVFYPLNDITLGYFFLIRVGSFSASAFWVIGVWVGLDVFGLAAVGDATGVAYLSHVSGCVAGVVIAVIAIKTGWLRPNDYERTLFDVIAQRRAGRRTPGSPKKASDAVLSQRLHVRISSGREKTVVVSEFLRHELQGKPVNEFPVSEDGRYWTTFGRWRRTHDV